MSDPDAGFGEDAVVSGSVDVQRGERLGNYVGADAGPDEPLPLLHGAGERLRRRTRAQTVAPMRR